jgi:hypothetical protein
MEFNGIFLDELFSTVQIKGCHYLTETGQDQILCKETLFMGTREFFNRLFIN